MQYALFFFETPEEHARYNTPEAPTYWAAWAAYIAMMAQAGVLRGGEGRQER